MKLVKWLTFLNVLLFIVWLQGAKYAFDILKTAPVPPNTDTHLLGHVVGDI